MLNIFKKKTPTKNIYLDYASLTPVDSRVLNVFNDTAVNLPCNPSSLYKGGVEAFKKLEQSRADIANMLEVQSEEIYFTSGGTESNNIAIKGTIMSLAKKVSFKPHVVTSAIEHPSVLEVIKSMVLQGFCDATFVPVDEKGVLDIKEFKKSLRPETVLVSIQYVNNEIGTIQPIKEIAKLVRYHRKNITLNDLPYIHTDACQAPVYIPIRIPSLGVDMLTIDASKVYGVRGTGLLYKRRGVKLEPLMQGGSQENDLRPGTENLAGIMALTGALKICKDEMSSEVARIRDMRDELLEHLLENVQNIKVNGSVKEDERLPNNINICLEGIDAEFAVLKLDVAGISVSSVTSCRSKNEDSSSYVISAMYNNKSDGVPESESAKKTLATNQPDCSKSSLRITLGRFTTMADISKAKTLISKCLTSML